MANINKLSSSSQLSSNYSLLKIVIVGAGYVGLSNAILLAQEHLRTQIILFDIDKNKVAQLNQKKTPLQDTEICSYLVKKKLNLNAVDDPTGIYESCDLVIIATPTNYETSSSTFDTSSIQSSIQTVRSQNTHVPIVIKSTIPIGFTESMHMKFDENILFMPEFLREGRALYDNLNPSRIIVGATNNQNYLAKKLIQLYQNASQKKKIPQLIIPPTEAEAVKLFANSYLATRIAFFNELDSFAEKNHLDSRAIITGIGLDSRIGTHYNNPSFGYGGYCLPKDTQQLKANYAGIPAHLINATIDANLSRKHFIAQQVINKGFKNVGVYRLSMKKDADNFRNSAILDIIHILKRHGLNVTVYEPSITCSTIIDCKVFTNVQWFKQQNDLIIANRWHDELSDIKEKVYSRDIFGCS